VLSEVGLAWETNAQLGWRLHWLESVRLVVSDNGKYQLAQPSPPSEMLLAHTPPEQ
jgi:hypothetical protein